MIRMAKSQCRKITLQSSIDSSKIEYNKKISRTYRRQATVVGLCGVNIEAEVASVAVSAAGVIVVGATNDY